MKHLAAITLLALVIAMSPTQSVQALPDNDQLQSTQLAYSIPTTAVSPNDDHGDDDDKDHGHGHIYTPPANDDDDDKDHGHGH